MIKNKKLKILVFLSIILLAIIPFIAEHNYHTFYQYPFQKTDITWKEPEVNCIKKHLQSSRFVQIILFDGENRIDFDTYNYYIYQFLFSPIILEIFEQNLYDKFVIVYNDGNQEYLQYAFPEYTIFSCSTDLYFLEK
jgi:hypothetical protein